MYQKRPTYIKRDLWLAKETHSHQNRPVKKSKACVAVHVLQCMCCSACVAVHVLQCMCCSACVAVHVLQCVAASSKLNTHTHTHIPTHTHTHAHPYHRHTTRSSSIYARTHLPRFSGIHWSFCGSLLTNLWVSFDMFEIEALPSTPEPTCLDFCGSFWTYLWVSFDIFMDLF